MVDEPARRDSGSTNGGGGGAGSKPAAADGDGQFLEGMLASATAGIISRIACHPLDTCKARLQNPGSEFTSTWQVVRQTLRQEGVSGLYRGLGTVVSIGTPAFVLYLATYEQAKRALCGGEAPALAADYQFVGHFVAGMTAETVSCLVYVPVDVVKERLQVQRRLLSGREVAGALPMYQGTWHALRTIMDTEGLRGVYRGYGATLLSFGPFSAFYFLFYEQFKGLGAASLGLDKTQTDLLPFHWTLASAASAGALASWITNPVDLVRLRLQVQRGSEAKPTPPAPVVKEVGGKTSPAAAAPAQAGAPAAATRPPPPPLPIPGGDGAGAGAGYYRNTWDGLTKVYRREGLRGLFRGSGARIAFYTPSTMISMSLYDELKKTYHRALSSDDR